LERTHFLIETEAYSRILKASLSWTRKSWTQAMQIFYSSVIIFSFLHLKPDFWYSSLSFVRLCC